MRRTRGVLLGLVLATAGGLLPGALPSTLAAPARPSGLPATIPAAATRAEPVLPSPRGWPGSEAFARTAGSSRLDRGAVLWTDYLYDDRGTTGLPSDQLGEVGVPSFGTYRYSDPRAHGNGADVFRAGVHLGRDATTWRVDWNTLADPAVPLAVWTMDTDGDVATGGTAWPAGAGVRSPGIDRALVVSDRGATLLDAVSGEVLARPAVTVDVRSRSFLVRVPLSVLPVAGTWKVRLGAGVADGAGTALVQPSGALPGQPRVHQVAFRALAQEPPMFQFWNDGAQVSALRTGDVSAFSLAVDWLALQRRTSTPEAAPKGWSPRWYASSVELGPGTSNGPDTVTGGAPNYLGRVQPYSVYIPASYDGRTPAPLTFLLHSLTQNHNQYASTTPAFTRQACEQRRSICVTTLGRGPDGSYQDAAELDFWEVWGQVARAYRVDPERTVVAGYSMGGFGTTRFATQHPDLFAKAVTLAGSSGASPGLANLRELPFYLAGGVADELVPVTRQRETADALAALGFRYRWLVYATDHVAYELQDDFADAATWMGDAVRTRNPREVSYTWARADERRAEGIGVTGAYWLTEVRAASDRATVRATSGMLAPSTVVPTTATGVVPPAGPAGPAVSREQVWAPQPGAGAPARTLALSATGASRVVVDLRAAGLAGPRVAVTVTTDVPLVLVLQDGKRSRTVMVPPGTTARTV